jgi:hypothetical protein
MLIGLVIKYILNKLYVIQEIVPSIE